LQLGQRATTTTTYSSNPPRHTHARTRRTQRGRIRSPTHRGCSRPSSRHRSTMRPSRNSTYGRPTYRCTTCTNCNWATRSYRRPPRCRTLCSKKKITTGPSPRVPSPQGGHLMKGCDPSCLRWLWAGVVVTASQVLLPLVVAPARRGGRCTEP
jgi:hypothetical protein